GYEVRPLENLELLVRRAGAAREDGRSDRGRGRAGRHELGPLENELPATLHGHLHWCGLRGSRREQPASITERTIRVREPRDPAAREGALGRAILSPRERRAGRLLRGYPARRAVHLARPH